MLLFSPPAPARTAVNSVALSSCSCPWVNSGYTLFLLLPVGEQWLTLSPPAPAPGRVTVVNTLSSRSWALSRG